MAKPQIKPAGAYCTSVRPIETRFLLIATTTLMLAKENNTMSKLRLDKFISNMTSLSRTEAVEAIYHNHVTVNGRIKKDPSLKVDPQKDEICRDGVKIDYEEFVYYMLNKPAGVVSATEDKKYKTVVDLIDTARDIAPVGRLDIDTEGLMLLTDDGKLAHRLISPKKHVDKVYYAEVDGNITEEVIAGFMNGMDYGEAKPSAPGKLEVITDNDIIRKINAQKSAAYVTIHEGKFHQIKRMFELYGLKVTYLKRISMGKLVLDETLAPGEYKKISIEDIE